MSKPLKQLVPTALQKLFIGVTVALFVASLVTGLRLLQLAYPGFEGLRLSSLTLMAISSFMLPLISFVVFYFISLRSFSQLHRAFMAAVYTTVITTLYEAFTLAGFSVQTAPLFTTPFPIHPNEILATSLTLCALAAGALLVRKLPHDSSQPSRSHVRVASGLLILSFVAAQILQLAVSTNRDGYLVAITLVVPGIVFGILYLAARYRNVPEPVFKSTVMVTLLIQSFAVVATIYAVSPTM
ncbi:TPA: hypothetical protein DEW05_04285 [Candidatus Saccharibacteria bacterium]|nr:hypothetical protein [Candidatus Saccharibacteria bacterium]